MLEMTDLVHHVEKFTKSALKVRRGNIKCYLVDLALRNSVLRIHESLSGIRHPWACMLRTSFLMP